MGAVIEDVVIVGPALQQLAAVHDKGARTVGRIHPFAALRADRQTQSVIRGNLEVRGVEAIRDESGVEIG